MVKNCIDFEENNLPNLHHLFIQKYKSYLYTTLKSIGLQMYFSVRQKVGTMFTLSVIGPDDAVNNPQDNSILFEPDDADTCKEMADGADGCNVM